MNSRNVPFASWETINRRQKIKTLIRNITFCVCAVIWAQHISETKLWLQEVFWLGWATEQITSNLENQLLFYSDELVNLERNWNSLSIKLKGAIDFKTILERSGFVDFLRLYYENLTKSDAISITRESSWEDVLFKIIKPFVFEEMAEKTINQTSLDARKSVYMVLLQNYIQSKSFQQGYDRVIIYLEFYDNKKRWRIDSESIYIKWGYAIRFLNNGDPVIPTDCTWFDYSSNNWWRKTKEEHSKSLIPDFLYLEENVFQAPYNRISVQFMFWRENLKYALENGFSFGVYRMNASQFQNLIMKTLISWSKQLNKKSYAKFKEMRITKIEIINNRW